MTIQVLCGVAAVNPTFFYTGRSGGKWYAWDTLGPVRETESRTPSAALRKYAALRRAH